MSTTVAPMASGSRRWRIYGVKDGPPQSTPTGPPAGSPSQERGKTTRRRVETGRRPGIIGDVRNGARRRRPPRAHRADRARAEVRDARRARRHLCGQKVHAIDATPHPTPNATESASSSSSSTGSAEGAAAGATASSRSRAARACRSRNSTPAASSAASALHARLAHLRWSWLGAARRQRRVAALRHVRETPPPWNEETVAGPSTPSTRPEDVQGRRLGTVDQQTTPRRRSARPRAPPA